MMPQDPDMRGAHGSGTLQLRDQYAEKKASATEAELVTQGYSASVAEKYSASPLLFL